MCAQVTSYCVCLADSQRLVVVVMLEAAMVATTDRKNSNINMRVSSYQHDLINRAADLMGRKKTDFILEAACQRAEDVLLDRTFFVCSAHEWGKVCEALDRSPRENQELAKVLSTKAPWES